MGCLEIDFSSEGLENQRDAEYELPKRVLHGETIANAFCLPKAFCHFRIVVWPVNAASCGVTRFMAANAVTFEPFSCQTLVHQ